MLTHLDCSICGARHEFGELQTICRGCGRALFARYDDFGSWIHEGHHAAKQDAPSGTALALRNAMQGAGYARDIDMSSTRAGRMPGMHTVGYDGPFDTVTLTHTARDRATFARGALEAARWVSGRRGWFSMRDVLGID